jgi:ABC-type multidrug transport system ATPase subunit
MEPICDSVAILARGVVRRQGQIRDLLGGESGRFRLRVAGGNGLSLESLRDRSLDLKVEGEEITMLFANQQQALAAAQEIANNGGTILELGAQTRSLEDVFIEAVAAGGDE